MDIKCQEWNSAYARVTKARGKGDEGAEGAALRQAQGPEFLVRSVSLPAVRQQKQKISHGKTRKRGKKAGIQKSRQPRRGK